MIGVFVILLIAGILLGPSVILIVIGLAKRSKKPESAKIFFILAVVYLIVAGGICASMLAS